LDYLKCLFVAFHKDDIAISTKIDQDPIDTGLNIDGVDHLLFSVRSCDTSIITIGAERGVASGFFINLGRDDNSYHTLRLVSKRHCIPQPLNITPVYIIGM